MFLIDGYELRAASFAPDVGEGGIRRCFREAGVKQGAPDWPIGVWGGQGVKFEETNRIGTPKWRVFVFAVSSLLFLERALAGCRLHSLGWREGHVSDIAGQGAGTMESSKGKRSCE